MFEIILFQIGDSNFTCHLIRILEVCKTFSLRNANRRSQPANNMLIIYADCALYVFVCIYVHMHGIRPKIRVGQVNEGAGLAIWQ